MVAHLHNAEEQGAESREKAKQPSFDVNGHSSGIYWDR